MPDPGSLIVVCEAYAARYADPLTFRAGDVVEVERSDPEFPEWYWCRAGGKEGWVHASYLSQHTGTASGVEDYSARELTVVTCAHGRMVHARGGWAYIELDDGRAGWVPERNIRDAI